MIKYRTKDGGWSEQPTDWYKQRQREARRPFTRTIRFRSEATRSEFLSWLLDDADDRSVTVKILGMPGDGDLRVRVTTKGEAAYHDLRQAFADWRRG